MGRGMVKVSQTSTAPAVGQAATSSRASSSMRGPSACTMRGRKALAMRARRAVWRGGSRKISHSAACVPAAVTAELNAAWSVSARFTPA